MTGQSAAVTVVAFVSLLAGGITGLAVNTAALAQASPRPTVSDVLKRATGRYPPPGKTDSVQFLKPPVNPTTSDVRDWVTAHNAAMLNGIRARFTAPEIQQFLAAERKECTESVYCQMTFRQQAIAVLLAGQG